MNDKRLGKSPLDVSRPVSQNIINETNQKVGEHTLYVSSRSADGSEALLVSYADWCSNPIHHQSSSGSLMFVTARFHADTWEEAKQRHEKIQYPSKVASGEICERCRTSTPRPSQTQPPHCAFLNTTFSPKNWCCRTIAVLRRASRVRGSHLESLDHSIALVPIPHELSEPPDHNILTHIMLQWYKDRGRTNQAVTIDGDGNFCTLTRDLAEKLANYYEDDTRRVKE